MAALRATDEIDSAFGTYRGWTDAGNRVGALELLIAS